MSQEIIMPKLGLTMTSGRISKWLKKEGDRIQKGEPVVEIETDKINSEVESEIDGYILKILAQEGEEREITAPICLVGEVGEAVAEEPAVVKIDNKPGNAVINSSGNIAVTKQSGTGRIFITPLAKKIARENGIDYVNIKGTGPQGRIVKADINNVLMQKQNTLQEGLNSRNSIIEKEQTVTETTYSKAGNTYSAEKKREPLSGMRKTIARRLSQSKHDIPHVYFKSEVDAAGLIELKNRLQDTVMKRTGKKLSLNDLILKAAAIALQEFETINASLMEDEIVFHEDINVGMAVSIEQGLVVPVIKNADKLSLSEISRLSSELSEKARNGKLALDDMTGGTFTVSNLGAYDIDEFSAIINPPESAILAVGKARERACIENGEIVIKPTMVLTLSVDHRVIDGALAARFMKRLKDLLEDTYSLLI